MEPPLWKKLPPLFQQPPSQSWGPVKLPLFENLVGGSTPPPPQQKEGGCTLCYYTGEWRAAAYSVCDLKYSIPEEVTIIFDNGSIHDYHFTIKELAEEFELQFTSLGENTEKYITFSVVIE